MTRLVTILFLCALAAVPCAGQNNVDGFIARVYSAPGSKMPYRLFVPKAYDKSQKYPLILWLHGAGSVGVDNFKQMSGASLRGTHTWTTAANQAKHPAFVVAPQSRVGWAAAGDELGPQLVLVLGILESLKAEFNIDAQRIYVAGQSMGGYGTWDFITKRPDLFAAAIPLCGGGQPDRAARIANIPIWAFHGDADPTVPVTESREMIAAIRKAGGNPRYSEYKGVKHEVWFRAFGEPGLVEWLFAQHK